MPRHEVGAGQHDGCRARDSTGADNDKALKNALMDSAAEDFMIASYKSLARAAKELGLPDIATACKIIMYEEEQMAKWVAQRFPTLTRMEL